MNKTILSGRATADATARYTGGDNSMCVARFTLAVDRKRKKGEEQAADFIRCVAFGKTGEFVEKYVTKGGKFNVIGHIQTGSYQNKEGQTVYTTDVAVEEIEFGESKKAAGDNASSPAPAAPSADEFMDVDSIDEELPFN